MEPLGVHHVSINVDDVPAALEFYVGVLGMTERNDRPNFPFPGAWLNIGAEQVHLIGGCVPSNEGQHFAVHVADIEATIAELRAGGHTVSDSIPVGPNFQAFINDPSGNLVELHQVG